MAKRADTALHAAKLAESGITLDDAEELGIELLSAESTGKLASFTGATYPPVPALLFKYFDPWSDDFIPVKSCHRVRLLAQPEGFPVELPKYLQPSGTFNRAYFPRVVNWSAVLSNNGEQVLITEGELKACAAALHGFPTIGLGGVDMFQANKRGIDLLPDLVRLCETKGRVIVVVYDNDANGVKPEVARAAGKLMEKLLESGAIPRRCDLPMSEKGVKVGLDDFLVARPNTAVDALQEVLNLAVPLSALETFLMLSERFIYVIRTGKFYAREDLNYSLPTSLFDEAWAGQRVTVPTMKVQRAGGVSQIIRTEVVSPLGSAYRQWPGRATVSDMDYQPGQPELLADNILNLWGGWVCKAKEGDVKPFFEMLDFVFGEDAVFREFIEHWLLYPLKYPGAKLYTAALVVSPNQGVGKTFVGEMFARHIYGVDKPDNASIPREGELQSDFNGYVAKKQFVLGDEITGMENRKDVDKLKGDITKEWVRYNEKFEVARALHNFANFYLTSNHLVPVRIDTDDRRFAVYFVYRAAQDKDIEKFNRWREWFTNGGAGHVLWYAQKKYRPGDFDPRARAPMTGAKQDLIYASRNDLESWAHEVVSGETTRDIVTPSELMDRFMLENGEQRQPSNMMLHQALKKAGARWWRDKLQQHRISRDVKSYIVVLRNHDRWNGLEVDGLKTEFSRVPKFELKAAPNASKRKY